MAVWSAENATKAYLKTLNMGHTHRPNQPDVVEFISALAAGNNAQLMVVACSVAADSSILSLVAAAHQTGGRVICILRGNEELQLSEKIIGLNNVCHIEFVIGSAQNLILTHYKEADFVLIDCNLDNHEGIFRAVQMGNKPNGGVVVGYNAFHKGSWPSIGSKTQLLPIGKGLLLNRIAANGHNKVVGQRSSSGSFGRSHWVVRVDQCTGEEHVFRVRTPQGRGVQA